MKLAGKKQDISPTWMIQMKDVDLGEPTSFLDHVNWGCTHRECQISKDIVDTYRCMFESRISAVAVENYKKRKPRGKLDAETISSWSCDLEGHAKKCVERDCELANKTTQQFTKTRCMDDHQLKEEEIGSVGELSIVWSQIVYMWHVFVDLIFFGLWTNLLVRSLNGQKLVTNVWRVWSLTFITHVNTGNIVVWGTQHNNADLDCFGAPIMQETLKTRSQHQEEILCIFGSHTFVPISWMCKKQTSVTHSSTEAEIISLDAGLRMDGIPALDLWDLVIEVFHSIPNQTNKTKDVREPRWNPSANTQPNMRKQIPTTHTNLDLTNMDHVPSSGTPSGCNAMLYVFEDNEAVIKIIIKGRSPTRDMCQEPTELLWIGCLTGLILILKSRFDTLIPNINSQTFWTKVILHVTNGAIFFVCSTSGTSALFADLRTAW